MDYTGMATLVGALVAALSALVTALVKGAQATIRWSKAQAKMELLAEQSKETVAAKDREIHEKNKTISELESENHRLLELLSRQENSP